MKKEFKNILEGLLVIIILGGLLYINHIQYNKAVTQCIESGVDSFTCRDGLKWIKK